MTPAPETPLELLKRMPGEARRHAVLLATGFAVIALATLAIAILLPKRYESHAVILAEAKNIITPLMEGRAVPTGVADRAAIVSQSMKSRRILKEVQAFGGWPEEKDARAEQLFLERLADRIHISQIGAELIRLSYRDTDPGRCLAITNKLAEIYIREGMTSKARQSSEAFEFIDRQVTEYSAKAAEAQEAVQAYYRAHAASTHKPAPPRPDPGESRRSASAKALAALRVEEAALAAQLGDSEVAQARQRREDRVQQLQRALDTLLGQFTEKHPSVLRAREELRLAQEEAARANAAEEPFLRAQRARLQELRARIAGAETTAAPSPVPVTPAQPPSPEMTVLAQDATLTELTRRYESTRDVYQDLLKRRENARVSMELDAEQRGLTLRMYENPELPIVPLGLRLMHIGLIGLALAVALPMALLFAYLQVDPRVRSARQLERSPLAALIVIVPYAQTRADRSAERRRILLATAIVGSVVATYAALLMVRLVSR
jgi:polysaccharide chain length determinant protein (PEP-CTERM system associated)